MNDVWFLSTKKVVEFPNCNEVLWRDFPAHLRNKKRRNPELICEVHHVIFAWRHGSCYQYGLTINTLQTFREPHHMLGWAADVQPSDDTNDLH